MADDIVQVNGIRYRVLPRTEWRFRARGWKYELAETYRMRVSIFPDDGAPDAHSLRFEWTTLSTSGLLTIAEGYAWDGPSGPAFDTPNFMRGSLVHDALYQLMGAGKLSKEWRRGADQELRRICLEDGMSEIRAWWVYWGVRLGGGSHVTA